MLERKGEVAYRLELPTDISGVHDVFHISQLRRCLRVPEEQAPLDGVEVQEDLTYTEHPVKILETSERVTRNKQTLLAEIYGRHRELLRGWWATPGDKQLRLSSLAP